MAAKFSLSAAADQQLDDIYQYTLANWGAAQAEKYTTGFFDLFAQIATGKVSGRLIQAEFGVQGRYVRYEKHFVYWKTLADDTIGIAEILHERMNAGDHLAVSASLNQDD